MTMTSMIQQLEALFRQQFDAAVELKQILKDEYEALVKSDHEQIRTLTQSKDEKSAEIEMLSRQQQALLNPAGLSLSKQSLDKLSAAAPPGAGGSFDSMRKKLESELQACQEQNLVNGQIIAVNRQSAEIALAILRGQHASGGLTYGSGGQTVTGQNSQQINKA